MRDSRHWLDRIDRLDPHRDFAEIYRIDFLHEFPWDLNQALSFALFRTYAVPSIGGLLHETGEFTGNTQKRYDDTVLLLDDVLMHGLDTDAGRVAVRRIDRVADADDTAQIQKLHDVARCELRRQVARVAE
jgi:hypothetical protein